MVKAGELSPDPSNRPTENPLHTDVTMPVLTSSDSEDEEISYEGYQVLPQDFAESSNVNQDDDSQDSSDDDSGEVNIHLHKETQLSGFDQATKTEVTELWNSSGNSRRTDIVMDSAKEEQIKNAMAGFKLPSTAIPQWAEHIPEEEWKEQIINRVTMAGKITSV